MWRCATRVAEGGLDYFDRPEGLAGVLKNYLFKIGFQGAFGKVWNAVMSIPEARKFQICMAASEKCKAEELLKNEVDTDLTNRLLINPEYVQDLDQSDGSRQYDKPIEDEA